MSESSEAPQIVVPPPTSSPDGNNVAAEEPIAESPPAKIQTPKRTPSKRKTFVEKAQAESEQLLKSMGIDIGGTTPGRRTRSGGARSSPVVPVESPAKRAKTATPKGRGRGKKILDEIVVEKESEEASQENSVESQNEEAAQKENHEEKSSEEKVDGIKAPEIKITEPIPEENEDVQKEGDSSEAEAKSEEKSNVEPVEPMEVDSASSTTTGPPADAEEPAVVETTPEAEADPTPVDSAQQSVEINAAQENELNTAEEIKHNNSGSSEESKTVQNEVSSSTASLPESSSNNHLPHPEEEPQTESSGNCQTETEPPAASNSDIVQTPQSCN